MITVSVVVPVYAGQDHLRHLVARIDAVRADWQGRFRNVVLHEAIFVDDGSIDASGSVLTDLAKTHDWVRVVTLSRNFGQHPATTAGILHSTGEWVTTLDEDLQHRPEDIEQLLRVGARQSADVIYGHPTDRVHGSWKRDLTSRIYKRLLAVLAGNRIIKDFSSFRVCRGSIARAAASVAGHETYLDVALTWFTDRFASTAVQMVDHRYLATGRSGYTLRRLLAHSRRLLISSHTKIARLAALAGLLGVIFAAVYTIRVITSRLSGTEILYVPGWASLIVVSLVFGGLVTLLLVAVLEYLVNIALHTQGKPTFFAVDRSTDAQLLEDLETNDGAA